MKRSIAILFTLLLVLAAVSVASAGKFSYLSGIQVQNLSSTDANVQLTYYNSDGSTDPGSPVADVISGNSSVTYFPVDAADGFEGSVVISSDQPVAAISNILGDLGAAAASYIGSSAGSTSVSLPLLFKNNAGFDTWFNVQNAGTSDASVSVAYSDGTSAGPFTIAPGAARTFDQATETHNSAVFSGVVSSDQPVAVAVIQESADVMFAYTGFTAGTPNPVMPLINANNVGYITGVQVQNTGGTATDVTVDYTAVLGTDCSETLTVPANGSTTFALFAFSGTHAGEDCADGVTFVGSAQVTANSEGHDLVAIVNQLKPGVNGEAYGSFDSSSATDTVVMPLIMDRNFGYFTGFNVQNVGGASTTVTCTFTNNAHTEQATLAAGEAMNALQLNALADGYVGSATCSAPGGSIIGVVNELGPSGTSDQLLVYEAINN